jgi:ATP-dependent Lon protease
MGQYFKSIPDGEEVKQTINLESCAKLAELVDKTVYHFDLPTSKMQEFLEEQDVHKRAESLCSLIELKNQLIQISKNMKDRGVDFSMN